jgi:hypothetical protein
MSMKRSAPWLMIILIIGTLSLGGIVHSDAGESQTCYSLDYGGLLLEVKAADLAWPGDKINITVRVEASAKIHVNFIRANVSSLKGGREEAPLLATVTFLENGDLDPGMVSEISYEVTIPEDALPGLIYGMVWYDWYIRGTTPATFQMFPQAFPATFIENKSYIELKEDYDALNSSYARLQANYTDLEEKYQQLASDQMAQDSATGLMYLFVATTAIFVVTTILLLTRRPKAATW